MKLVGTLPMEPVPHPLYVLKNNCSLCSHANGILHDYIYWKLIADCRLIRFHINFNCNNVLGNRHTDKIDYITSALLCKVNVLVIKADSSIQDPVCVNAQCYVILLSYQNPANILGRKRFIFDHLCFT